MAWPAQLLTSFAAIFATVQAPQAPLPPPIATVNGWRIYDDRGHCSAMTVYDRQVVVRVSYDHGADRAFFFIANPAWESVQDGATYRISVNFSNGSDYTDASAQGIREDSEHGRTTGIMMMFDGSDFVEDFAFAAATRLHLGGLLLDSLSLRGTREVMTRLVRCAADSYRRYPPDPFASVAPAGPIPPTPGAVTGPVPARANLSSYFSTDDYPPSALRAGEEGTTQVRLGIGPDGRVAECTIVSSSGSAALDSATCRIVRSRARFTPARDAGGRPTAGTMTSRVTWRLPPVPVPPPVEPAGQP